MAKQVTIRISAEDQFSSVINRYNQAVGGAASNSKALETNSRGAQGGMASLTGAVQTGIALFGALKIADVVTDVTNLGREANLSSARFNALAEDIGGGQGTLEQLQTVTGGIVDNMALMQGAGQLLQMNLADNSDELARMTEMAVKLKRPTMDASKAFDDFSLMLANQSIMRLDQFGISSGAVRREIDRLIETGQAANREEAFKLAVLSEGEKALERLGAAAEAAETPLSRLETRFANFAQEQAGYVADTAQWWAGAIENATGQNPAQLAQQEAARAAANTFASEYQAALIERLSARGAGGFGSAAALMDLDMLQGLGGEAGRALIEGIAYEIEMNPAADIGSIIFQQTGIRPDSPAGAALISGFRETMREMDTAAQEEMESARWKEYMQNLLSAPGELFTQGESFLNTLLDTAQESGVLEDHIKQVADEAERAQKAFENMKLADVFGTTGGGMGGEITDRVLASMRANGATEEQIAAMQRALDLQSGRETTSSLHMQETLIPMMAGMSPEQAAAYQANMVAAYQAVGTGQGMNVIGGGLNAMFGGLLPEGGIDVSGALTGIGGLLGMDGGGSVFGQMNDDLLVLDERASNVAGTFDTMTTNLAPSVESLNEMSDTLTDISGVHDVEVRIKFSGQDLDTLKLLQGGAPITTGGSTLETQVINNGGRVPGTSSRTATR